nr:MAG TPA: hypothetical protein [Caudoviricetes sp.]
MHCALPAGSSSGPCWSSCWLSPAPPLLHLM